MLDRITGELRLSASLFLDGVAVPAAASHFPGQVLFQKMKRIETGDRVEQTGAARARPVFGMRDAASRRTGGGGRTAQQGKD